MRRTAKRRLGGVVGVAILWLASAAMAVDGDSEAPAGPEGKIEFIGKNLFATANGTFHRWQIVESELDADALADAPAESFVVVRVDLASIDTGIERRDEHLRNPDFFEVEKYPTATVRVHSFRADGETEAGRPRYLARFDFDLHGVTKTIEGEVVHAGESPLRFEGSLVIDRTDFGIGAPPSRWNPMSVAAEIPIRFEVEL